MSQDRKQIAIFPDMPRDNKVIDEKGVLIPEWSLFFSQLTMSLQTHFKPEGFVAPPKSAAEIALLGNVQGAIGNIIYDNTNQQFKGIVTVSIAPDGTVVTATKTFTLT